MGNRFGRNQKRRMRAELAELQAELAARKQSIDQLRQAMMMDRGLLREKSNKLEALREHLANIAAEVGNHSTLLGVTHSITYGFDGMRLSSKPRPLLLANALSVADVGNTHLFITEVIRLLNVEVVRDHFDRMMHCRVDLAGKFTHYGISESAIRNMTPEELARRIAPEIASDLVEKLKRAFQADAQARGAR